jgi:putative transposase
MSRSTLGAMIGTCGWSSASGSVLDEIVREAARQMLAVALQAEVSAYIDAHAEEVDEAILPAWACKSPRVAEVLPLLYLHGLSSSDFGPALTQFLGTSHGLSAATITRLTKDWQDGTTTFNKRSLAGTDYVYCWVDGSTSRSGWSRTKCACW